ncbi:DNA polymerase III subunit epsilon [Sphingobacterium sp. DK4209]|uniref:DNA polymerase III subunit epsilon n=1 Tax=Sphingobacterium zhuxiongii TaxID=2662364 RepID=A0A5Q0QCS3_9SPHI|nr:MULTISPECIES: exonuclease domain-containing protein [unclassified Sphingobacterium]MVZ65781.1 DNA polymerase III subunit epsilon [Sphingobacterium sp. DK4209]QGA27977.1 DNA polymerase III subunit epsilon [Sphingobacterium sp. dk4302]
MSNTFTSIDFELATAKYSSVCAVGIVNVVNGIITNEFYSLVRPPENKYMWQTSRVHGIKSKHTEDAPSFIELFPQIDHLLKGQVMVAHDELLDRSVLKETMKFYDLSYQQLQLPQTWECTSKIYRALGFERTKLSICCEIMGVSLQHHDALSDARATAELYLKIDQVKNNLKSANHE